MDHDGLENWQEYMVGTMRCWRYDDILTPWEVIPDEAYWDADGNFKPDYAKINALFGSLLMTSDNPKTYDRKKANVLNEALKLFKDGKVLFYERRKQFIYVEYEVEGVKHAFYYNTKKGVIKNG